MGGPHGHEPFPVQPTASAVTVSWQYCIFRDETELDWPSFFFFFLLCAGVTRTPLRVSVSASARDGHVMSVHATATLTPCLMPVLLSRSRAAPASRRRRRRRRMAAPPSLPPASPPPLPRIFAYSRHLLLPRLPVALIMIMPSRFGRCQRDTGERRDEFQRLCSRDTGRDGYRASSTCYFTIISHCSLESSSQLVRITNYTIKYKDLYT